MKKKNITLLLNITMMVILPIPNGSPWSVAGVCSKDGRHLAMMPHPERALFPWQCGYYPNDRKNSDEVTPWIEGFVNAYKWIEGNKK